jgi:hypothetical protein
MRQRIDITPFKPEDFVVRKIDHQLKNLIVKFAKNEYIINIDNIPCLDIMTLLYKLY